ncbi:MAG: CBS domain-containing protein, partial [Ignavibacteriae bacterium]|nr:CBS domain-containing protein [Ignavibacteriota bacterium]
MSNTINHRIYDFLKEHPPFSFITKDELLIIASQISILYLESDNLIFSQGEIPPDYFYVIREGAVKLFNEYRSDKILIDICDEGDIFGIRPLISVHQPYTLTAVVSEEALIYKIPTSFFISTMKTNKSVEDYFSSSFAGGIRNPYSSFNKQKAFDYEKNKFSDSTYLSEVQTIQFNTKPISCKIDTKIKDAAKIMRSNNVGSLIIVDESFKPIGIITDRDLRNKVVGGDVSLESEILEIMNSPVITAHSQLTASDLQILMIKNNIHHVVITKDGSANSEIIGMVSEHDILVMHGNNPSAFIREIKRSTESGQLRQIRVSAEQLVKKYLDQEVSISYISRIITEINNSITSKAIEITMAKLQAEEGKTPDVKWCWLALGSQGREEQLLRSDQDNALVFEDVNEDEYE